MKPLSLFPRFAWEHSVMNRCIARFAGAAAATAAFLVVAAIACAETWPLELKRLGSENRSEDQMPSYVYRTASAQTFYCQMGGEEKSRIRLPGADAQAAAFKRIIKKEPKYESKHPLRGVAKLGSHEYAFALDAIPPKPKAKETKSAANPQAKPDSAIAKLAELLVHALAPESPPAPKSPVYNRLYFDFNRNGDLTDDKVVEAETSQSDFSYNYQSFSFPRIDAAIDAGGTKLAYSFLLNGYVNAAQDVGYVVVSLNAAVYREGNITLAGKKHHVVLIDFNSNGRFDDETTFSAGNQASGGQLVMEPGDRLLVDPDRATPTKIPPTKPPPAITNSWYPSWSVWMAATMN